MRADARRNRAKLLEAAEAVFAEHGTAAPTDEVTRAAGVGAGTLFRHFPTKEALLEAVYLRRLEALAERAESLADSGADSGAAFRELFAWAVAQSAAKSAYVEALIAAGVDVEDVAADARPRLHAAVRRVLTQAQEAGAVRKDVTGPDVMRLLIGAARAVEQAGDDARARELAVQVVLDGLLARP